jgi:hypothetical protein
MLDAAVVNNNKRAQQQTTNNKFGRYARAKVMSTLRALLMLADGKKQIEWLC